jgi:hypothetical protein
VLYLNPSIRTFTPPAYLNAHGDLSMRYLCFLSQFFFDTEICFSTVVEDVGNLPIPNFFTMLDGKLFIRLGYHAARKLESNLNSGG